MYFSSTSLGLVLDLKALLLRFGVLTRMKMTTKAHYRPSFNLHIYGTENQRSFLERIGTFGPKSREEGRIRDILRSTKSNTNVDTVPIEIWSMVRRMMSDKGVTTRGLAANLGTAYCGSTLYKHCPSRERLGRVAALLEEPALERLAGSDVFWDRIASITPLGPRPVFDASVPGTHNFIANGIIAHNSIEQDADVVLFVFREEMYKGQPGT
jgi:replicative DNA helicase